MKRSDLLKYSAFIFAIFLLAIGLGLPLQVGVKAALTNYGAEQLKTVAQPAKGGTYIDPTFGTKILRVTDGADATNTDIAYSYWPAFNNNSTKMIIALDWVPYLYTFNPSNLTFQKIGPMFASDPMLWEGM